ncbi:MAG: membrane protein insertase YidC [Chloroflexi bacterium]|nr:membrane protein insertase YidC [Chloroflexota bacterium]MBI3763469.1 membrane protein insertase YidC [Chloroflexota bacterium]
MNLNLWNSLILDPMVNALLLLYSWLGQNFTLSLTVFTVLVRMLTLPLTWQQQKSSKVMAELQKSKEWLDMQKKYAKDKQALGQAQMKLYQEKGINPLSGCLPTLIQFPILIGLYQAITRVMATTPLQLLDLYAHIYRRTLPNAAALIPVGNRFFWLNLGQPDPWYILPVLVVVTTWLQQKLITPPAADPQSAQMTQSMAVTMPLMFGFFSLSFPSGLSIYFVIANLIGIAQYGMMGKIELPDFVKKLLPAIELPDFVKQYLPASGKTSSSAKPSPAKAVAKKSHG